MQDEPKDAQGAFVHVDKPSTGSWNPDVEEINSKLLAGGDAAAVSGMHELQWQDARYGVN